MNIIAGCFLKLSTYLLFISFHCHCHCMSNFSYQQVVKDNLKMKRQSAMLIQQMSVHSVPIDFESIGEDINTDSQGDSQVEHLNQTIAGEADRTILMQIKYS